MEEDWPTQVRQELDQTLLRRVQTHAAQTAHLFQCQKNVCPLVREGEDDPRGHHSEQVFVYSKALWPWRQGLTLLGHPALAAKAAALPQVRRHSRIKSRTTIN